MNYHFILIVFVVANKLSSISSNIPVSIPELISTTNSINSVLNAKLVTSRLNSSHFNEIFTPALRKLEITFQRYGYEIRIVGGAVRDLLMNKTPSDLDFATPATPPQMKSMFKREKIFMVNMNGEKHGTITPHIGQFNFEITTLRKDALCDGRHAIVQFTTDWEVDAARRDLTVNAMFLGFDGTVYDYFNGKEDLQNRRIVFVGDPAVRIREDYLRILRYFRFFGRLARPTTGHDTQTLEAIRNNIDGLINVSGERIWTELQRILSGPACKSIVFTMLDAGLAPQLGLPSEGLDKETLSKICSYKTAYDFKPITFIAALLNDTDSIEKFNERCRLSREEKDLAIFLVNHKHKEFILDPEHVLKPFQELLITAQNKDQVKAFILELIKFKDMGLEVMKKFESWDIPRFPIEVPVLRQRGLQYGRQIGYVLTGLKKYWVQKNFNITDDELLQLVPALIDEFRQFLNTTTVAQKQITKAISKALK